MSNHMPTTHDLKSSGRELVGWASSPSLLKTKRVDGLEAHPTDCLMATPSNSPRTAITIMEVLISIAIVAIGLLGVIAMLPIGHMFVQNAIRSDHAIALSEKGFNDVMLRGWLSSLDLDEPVAVDPLYSGAGNVGGSNLARTNAGISGAMANEIFVGTDDVTYDAPATVGGNPQVIYIKDDSNNNLKRGYTGAYEFMVTVVPQGAGSRTAKVSVAAFFNRNAGNEITVNATPFGGGYVELEGAVNVKKNQWILLEDSTDDFYAWYRVISAADGDDGGTAKTWVTLDASNIPSGIDGAIIFDQVLSVYEETVTIPE